MALNPPTSFEAEVLPGTPTHVPISPVTPVGGAEVLIPGPTGPTGPEGPQGIQGIQGIQGPEGAPGGGLVFENSPTVTFGSVGGTYTASVATNYQSQGNYLTTAMASNRGSDFAPAGAYLTTAAQSNHSHGNPTLALTNLSGTTASNSNGVTFSLSAAAPGGAGGAAISAAGGSQNTGTVVFSNSNGVSFGYNAGVITATVNPGAAAGIAAIGGGASTVTNGTVVFAGSNGVTFGMSSNGQITASVQTNYQTPGAYLTTAMASNEAHIRGINAGTGTLTSGTVVLSGSNGITVRNNGQTAIIEFDGHHLDGLIPSGNGYGTGFSSMTSGTIGLSAGQGVSFSQNGNVLGMQVATNYQSQGAYLTTAAQSGHTHGSAPSITGQISVTSNSNAWSISIPAFLTTAMASNRGSDFQSANVNYLTSQSNQALSGSNGSFAFQTASFGASNGATFYTTNGSMVVSYTVPTVPGATVFSNSNNVSFGLNGSTVTATATFPAQTVQPVAVSASNGSYNFSTLKFVEGSGVTWATQANGIQASVKTDYQSQGAYLTTAANSTHSHGNPTLALTNLNGTTASNSAGFTLSLSAAAPGGGGAAISAGTVSQNTGTIVFSNSNGVSFGMGTGANAGVITATVNPGAAAGIAALGGGASTVTSGTVVFANSNGVSFGMSSNGQITASVATAYQSQGAYLTTARASNDGVGLNSALTANGVSATINSSGMSLNFPAFLTTAMASNRGSDFQSANPNYLTTQTVQPVAVSASNGSYNFSTLKFVQGGGVTFSTDSNGINATIKTDYQTAGAYLTTAAGSNHTHGSGPSITGQISVTSNSNAWSISIPAFLTTAMASNRGSDFMSASQSNNYFYTSNNTFANNTHVHGGMTLNLTNVSASSTSASNGLTLNLSVADPGGGGGAAIQGSGTYSQNTGTVQFANSNGVTFGLSNDGVMTASIQPGAAAGIGAFADSAQTVTSGTLVFSNSNNVSFGVSSNGVVTASAAADLTLYAAGNTTLASSTVVPANSLQFWINAGSLGFNNGSLMISQIYPTIATLGISGNTNSRNSGMVNFSNSNNVSFGLATNGVMTGSVLPNHTIRAGTNSRLSGVVSFVDSNSVSFGMDVNGNITGSFGISMITEGAGISFSSNGSTMTIAHIPDAVSAANGSSTFRTLSFANSNGVSFGTGTQGLYASVETSYLTTAAQSGHSHGNPTLALTNLTGTTASGSNGLTLSLSAAAPGGGGASPTVYWACPPWQGNSNALISNITATRLTQRPLFFPFRVDGNLQANEVHWVMSRATSGSNAFSVNVGIYSFANSSQISLVGSTQNVFSHTATASISGVRQFEAALGTNMSSLTPGNYILGMAFSAANTASMNYSLMGAATNAPAVGVLISGTNAYHTYTSHQALPFWGIYTATSAAMPSSVGLSQISANINSFLPMYFTLANHN